MPVITHLKTRPFRILIIVCFLLASHRFLWASSAVVSDETLKLMTIDLMKNHLVHQFYKIEDLNVYRTLSGEKEFAVAVNNIWTSSGGCFSYLAITDSDICRSPSNCTIETKVVDCAKSTDSTLFSIHSK